MKIIMKQTIDGSTDGRNTITFFEGNEYNVPSEISLFLAKGWIERQICVEKKDEVENRSEEEQEEEAEHKRVEEEEECKRLEEESEEKKDEKEIEKEEVKSIINYENKSIQSVEQNKSIDETETIEQKSEIELIKKELTEKGIFFHPRTNLKKLKQLLMRNKNDSNSKK